MTKVVILCLPIALVLATAPVLAQQTTSITQTRHNLSVGGPGQFRAESQGEVCVFCHAPHGGRLQVPLWNREDTTSLYLTYQSSTFQGNISQPNGTTRLCLSCHDGTIALGRVVSLTQEIQMLSGQRFLDSGPAFLGVNLRDDHPVSFHYATSRGGSGIGFRAAAAIVPPVHLDDNGLVQCTSCHEPHDNQHGKFLRRTDRQGDVCLACHQPVGWPQCSHGLSPAQWNGSGTSPWPLARYTTVSDNACMNCHRPHGAGSQQRLLNSAVEEQNCLRCHNSNVAAKNIEADLLKPFAHPVLAISGIHDPTENPLTMSRHAECFDCHNPHQVQPGAVAAPGVPGPQTGISGINLQGAVIQPINFGYELCFKCHGDNHGTTVYVPRVLQQANVRLEYDPSNPSFHPVAAPGRNSDVPSLIPPLTTTSRIACTDCHQSDTSSANGGTGPRGPHGSVNRPILARNYTTADNTSESPAAYALCYGCHSRASILSDNTFGKHRYHVVEKHAPCCACHDSHGISASQGNPINNAHLINFNSSIVQPRQGVIRYSTLGIRRGECTLVCHGEEHDRRNY